MTDKEKAKAYDEVVNKIKPLYEQARKDNNPIWSTYEYLIPALHENDDERIRKGIIAHIQGHLDTQDDFIRRQATGPFSSEEVKFFMDALAWLEKQKELSELGKYIADKRSKVGFYCNHKEVSWNEIPLEDRKHDYPYYFDGDIDCYPFVISKQKKPKELFDVNKFFVSKDVTDFKKELFFIIRGSRELKPTDEEIWLNIENQIAPNLIDILQEEKSKNITANLLEDGITGVQRELIEFLANNIDVSWVDVIKSADVYAQRIRSMVEKQKDQKPIEDVIKNITKNKEATTKFLKSAGIMDDNGELAEMYRSEQKPAEWSEEDKMHLSWIIECFDSWKYQVPEFADHYQSAIDWLKSLRPQYHGDVTMTEAYKMGFEAGKASSWKPSEEQMEALESAMKLYKDTHFEIHHKKIVLLYEQLKKLM